MPHAADGTDLVAGSKPPSNESPRGRRFNAVGPVRGRRGKKLDPEFWANLLAICAFFALCVAVIWWIFRAGWRLRS